MKDTYEFKRDKYVSARGEYSRLVDVCCRKCQTLVAVYQKDGPGNLRRMYMDRIFAPAKLVGLGKKGIQKIANLNCTKCKESLGTPYVYKKENRKAFKLYQDAVTKKVRKLDVTKKS